MMEKIKVLCIDDEPKQRKALCGLLRAKDYSVTAATSGQSGFDVFKKRSFDVVFCDLNMPMMNGLEFLEKAKRVNPDVPVIILTSHGTIQTAVKSLKKGAFDFILEPPKIEEVEAVITKALETTRLHKQLSESKDNVGFLVKNVPDIIYSLSPKGIFLDLSPAVKTNLGFKPKELIGTSVFNMIHPEDRKRVREGFKAAVESGEEQIRSVEFRMFTKTGEARHFEVRTRMIVKNGKVLRAVGIARDITERKIFEEEMGRKNMQLEELLTELLRSRDELQAIMDSYLGSLVMVDREGKLRRANRVTDSFFGIQFDKLVNKPFVTFLDNIKDCFDDFDKFRRVSEMMCCLTPEQVAHKNFDAAMVYRNSIKQVKPKERFILPMGIPVFDRNKVNLGTIWIFNDITIPKRTYEQLESIVNASPVPVLVSRLSDRSILFVNDNLARLMGYKREEVLGRTTPDFYYDQKDRKHILQTLKKNGYVHNQEIRVKKADGNPVWVLLSVEITQIGDEQVVISGLYDISQRKRTEEALEKERNFISAILDTTSSLIIVLDREGQVVRFNKACESVTGWAFKEIKGKHFWDFLLLPEEVERVREVFKELRAGIFPNTTENYWLTKDGRRRLTAWTNTALMNEKGRVEYIIGTGTDITDHREIENALMESEKKYRELVENANSIILRWNSRGNITFFNEYAQKFFGYSEKEILGQNVMETIVPERDSAGLDLRAMIEDIGQNPENYISNENENIKKNGERVWITWTNKPIYDDSENVTEILSIGKDDTERKKAEDAIATRLKYEEELAACSQALLSATEMKEAITRALNHLLIASNTSRAYIFENFQDEKDGLCMRQLWEVCAPGVSSQIDNPILQHLPYGEVLKTWKTALSQNKPFMGITRFLESELKEILKAQDTLSILIIPIWINDLWYGFIGFDDNNEEREWSKEDVSLLQTASSMIGGYLSRQLALKALQESEGRFRGIVENANDIIFTLSPEGEFSYISPNVKEILGFSTSELTGRHFTEHIHPDDLEAFLSHFHKLKQTGAKQSGIEHRIQHSDKSWRYHRASISPLKDSEGNILSYVGIAHDFTEVKNVLTDLEKTNRHLKEAQIQLVQSEKMASLGQLVAGIAHEINTPIGAINSMHDTLFRTLERMKEFIQQELPEDCKQIPKLNAAFKLIDDSNSVIKSGAERVINIVTRLKSFARLDEADLKTVDIHEGIEDTLVLIHHELKHNITVVKNYGNVPPFSCFPSQLNQVFLNLLVNSKQAIKDKGTITITTYVKNRNAHIRFADDGVGIPKESLSRIFDPGFTTKGIGVGTGLGLSISYNIIQNHMGEIKVTSEMGKGTEFLIILPMDLKAKLKKRKSQAMRART